MILMTQKIGRDGPTQRCDARCYNAKGGKCACICGGRNHSAGIEKALDNVRQEFAPLLECEHRKIIGTCEHGCYKPRQSSSDAFGMHIPRKTQRELRRHEEIRA